MSSRSWSSPATRWPRRVRSITVESDKATMEIPSPAAGVVKELRVKVGDKVAEGSLILLLEEAGEGAAPAAPLRADARCGFRAASSRTRRRDASRQRSDATSAAARAAAGSPHRAGAVRACRRGRGFQAARESVGAQVRARARRRSGQSEGHRSQGPHHAGRRAGVRQGRDGRGAGGGARGRAAGGAALQSAGMAAGGFRQVRPGRDEAAVAHQEALGREPAPQLGFDPARHPVRRGRHHRARGVPQDQHRARPKSRASSSPCSPS